MRAQKIAVAIILVTTLQVAADSVRVSLPFEPVYAYQQKKITFDSLSWEISQFQSLSRWHHVLGDVQTRRLELETQKRSFERGQKLFKQGRISRTEFLHRQHRFQMAEYTLAELEGEAEMARISAEIARFGLQENGDDDADFRREIALKMRESLRHQAKTLESGLAAARLSETLLKEELESGRVLHEKGNLTLAELEHRELSYRRTTIRVETLQSQYQVVGQAIHGINASLEKLFGQTPRL